MAMARKSEQDTSAEASRLGQEIFEDLSKVLWTNE